METRRKHRGHIRWVRRVGNHRHVFSWPKIAAHCIGEYASLGYTIVPEVFARLGPSNVAKPPSNNTG